MGTVHSMTVPREYASKIVSQTNEFEKFHSERCDEIAKAALLVMMIILEILLTLNTTIKDFGVIVGIWFEGHPKITHYVSPLFNTMMTHAASDMTAAVPKVLSDVLPDRKMIPFFDP